MPDDPQGFSMMLQPTAERPLLGLTVLMIEDSRFASEAVRLLCLRSGARIRRAGSLAAARRHLAVYRPAVVLVDLGLPDGSGLDLIRDLANATPRIDVVIGISGDDNVQQTALDAGADDFIAKPIPSLNAFQSRLLALLPPEAQPKGPRALRDEPVAPDPMALQDDLAHVADILTNDQGDEVLAYIAQFLGGVARSAGDSTLEEAAQTLARHHASGGPVSDDVARVARLVQARLEQRAAI